MKKYLLILLAFLLVGCTKNNSNEITYSNISDDKSLSYVTDLLLESGLSSGQVEKFEAQVKTFYNSVGTNGMVNEFAPFSDIKYDPYKLQENWSKKNNYMGYNCRITVYTLFNELFRGSGYDSNALDYLIFDQDTLQNDKFSNEDISKFDTMFQSIETEKTTNVTVHQKKIEENFKKYNISFQDSNIKMVSVYIHDDSVIKPNTNLLFIGHTGILLNTDNNYLFIEKLAFSEPYQAVKFKTLDQLKEYLMKKYDTSKSDGTAQPIIMINDEIL